MIIMSFRHTNSTKANQLNNYLGRTYYIYMHCCVTFSFLLIHLFAAAVAFFEPYQIRLRVIGFLYLHVLFAFHIFISHLSSVSR